MTEVRLSFSVSSDKLNTFRFIVDHLLTLLGVTRWRWEFGDGAGREVVYGPYPAGFTPPQVLKIAIPIEAAERFQKEFPDIDEFGRHIL